MFSNNEIFKYNSVMIHKSTDNSYNCNCRHIIETVSMHVEFTFFDDIDV